MGPPHPRRLVLEAGEHSRRKGAPHHLPSHATRSQSSWTLKPKSVKEAQPGRWVFDMGQNMVGVARIKVNAPAGTKLTLRHAEMLNPDGTLYVTNLRGAPSIDNYICKGGGEEVWQPASPSTASSSWKSPASPRSLRSTRSRASFSARTLRS